jgi:hypothetical protein
VEGTNKAHENGEAMGFVGVSLTAELGHGVCAKRPCPSSVMALPLPERWHAPVGGQLCIARSSSVRLVCSQKEGKLRVRVDLTVRLGRGVEGFHRVDASDFECCAYRVNLSCCS